MNPDRSTLIVLTSLGASLLISIQAALIILQGEAFCLNEGCRVVEGLTLVPPLLFNGIGLAYFLSVFVSVLWSRRGWAKIVDWTALILLAGLAVEGVLLAYQVYVVRTFCLYCLLILGLVLALNILKGRGQMVRGTIVLTAILFTFPLLSFGPSLVLSRYSSLDGGTYAVRTCTAPTKELYLFFSADCPHCRNVLDVLEDCNSCSLHFNPVERVESLDLPGIDITSAYSPKINRLMLTLLGVDEVPVLLVKSPDGFYVIRGDRSIVAYVRQACFQDEPLLYIEPQPDRTGEEIMIFEEPDEGCSVKIECDE